MTDFSLDYRDLRPKGRPDDERRFVGRRREDLLLELALAVLPGDLLDAERAYLAAVYEGLGGPDVYRKNGIAEGLARALQRLTGEPAEEIRARAVSLILEETSRGVTGAETCRRMLEGSSGS